MNPTPTPLEEAAIALHDFLYDNLGYSDDWPIHLSGDDEAIPQLVNLFNQLQDEIKAGGLSTKVYELRPVL